MRNIMIALAFGLLSTPLLAVDKDDAEFAGSCAWGLAEYGAVVPTDCSLNWTDPKTKKTYCFSSEKSKKAFLQNPEQNERRAAEKSSELHK
jgi:membrane-associated PAP2 superfamily phosphatase